MANTNVIPKAVEWQSMKQSEISHLAGFFDGVGNISLRVVKDADYKIGYTLRPLIEISKRNENDPALGKVAKYCEEQGVTYSVIDQTENSVKLSINNPDSIKRFLEPLSDHLLTNLVEAEVMLHEVLPAMKAGKHREKDGFYELMEIVDQMRNQEADRDNVKYTQEFFKNEWSVVE